MFYALTFLLLTAAANVHSADGSNVNKQFDSLYKELKTVSLPVDCSYCSRMQHEAPKHLYPIFEFKEFEYITSGEETYVYKHEYLLTKLPEYKKFKIFIVEDLDIAFGDSQLYLYTFSGYKLIDKLLIYKEQEEEYNGETGVMRRTSFVITKNYDILIKKALTPNPGIELEVVQKKYIISNTGKFVENL